MNPCEMDLDIIAQEDDRGEEDIADGDEISKLILCLYTELMQPATGPSCFIRALSLNRYSSLFSTILGKISFLLCIC